MDRAYRAQTLLLAGLALFAFTPFGGAAEADCPTSLAGSTSCHPEAPKSFLPDGLVANTGRPNHPDLDVLAELLESISVMQNDFFDPWQGTWPTSIDWTGAVMGTHVSGALHSISDALPLLNSGDNEVESWKLKENLIDTYFTQVVSYHFGQNALEIRGEAFDDILWVVLGWLEAVEFINAHTDLHYAQQTQEVTPAHELSAILKNQTWYGNQWIPAFAHRARVFWGLASTGWDTALCGGGMDWNPRLLPYKNSITNELYIAGSIAMYLYFPGDNNTSPFSNSRAGSSAGGFEATRDPKYLKAAVDGYKWLASSNMTDAQGLYTDGFHISGYGTPGNNNTKCDERNDMVFTYNQGVLLTGQRGLWEATGAVSYLTEGHRLIQNVIRATGYDLKRDGPLEEELSTYPASGDDSNSNEKKLPRWHGLGRLGVLEDQCDASGTCSQDVQTFKGIYFHHLTYFCQPLGAAPHDGDPDSDFAADADARAALVATKKSHEEACASYGGWLAWNARAALATRDAQGRFGGWWTAGLLFPNLTASAGSRLPTLADDGIVRAPNATDYRSYGVPNNAVWRGAAAVVPDGEALPALPHVADEAPPQKPVGGSSSRMSELRRRERGRAAAAATMAAKPQDPNARGRGRTVETQGSGLALIRAYWQIAQAPLATADAA